MASDPDPVITWETRPASALEFTVNFGVFARAEEWLNGCLTGVSGQKLTHAELLARDAVVKGVLGDAAETTSTPG